MVHSLLHDQQYTTLVGIPFHAGDFWGLPSGEMQFGQFMVNSG